jgi:hypothetical protein
VPTTVADAEIMSAGRLSRWSRRLGDAARPSGRLRRHEDSPDAGQWRQRVSPFDCAEAPYPGFIVNGGYKASAIVIFLCCNQQSSRPIVFKAVEDLPASREIQLAQRHQSWFTAFAREIGPSFRETIVEPSHWADPSGLHLLSAITMPARAQRTKQLMRRFPSPFQA